MRALRPLLLFILGFCPISLTFGQIAPVNQTGQKKCYDDNGGFISCKGTGQDGEFRFGTKPPGDRFGDNHNGTVTDHLTNITWLKNADCYGAMPFQNALTLANTLANGSCGLSDQSKPGDWRMANIIELQSLLDFGQVGFALPNGNPFTNVSTGTYWTSTQSAAAPPLAWFITLSIGPTVFDVKINTFHFWPVKGGLGRDARLPKTGQTTCWDPRGAPIPCAGTGQDGEIQAGVAWPIPRFTDNQNGTVTDNLTGLIWLKDSNCLGFASFSDALKRSSQLAAGACGLTDKSKRGDWRLPNIRELQSIQAYNTFAPDLPVGHPFVNVQPTLTWTSTSGTGFAAQAWFTIFGVGPSVFEDKAVSLAVWPVKGGNKSDDDDSQGDESDGRSN
jgi:hypothetical protein